MKKNIAGIADLFLGSAIILVLTLLFYLTQKNYLLLLQSNKEVIKTSHVISGYQKVSADFKNAIIYISTYKNSPSQAYVNTYGKGLWELSVDVIRLKRLVSDADAIKLSRLKKQIYLEEDWLMSPDTDNPLLYDERATHIQNIMEIQHFFDDKTSALEQQSIRDIKAAEQSLSRLHYWIITLIISTSVIILLTLYLIRKQLIRVKLQNGTLTEIAWMQSHKVRAQVSTLLGLCQLFNHDDPTDAENAIILKYMATTCDKLDEIVKEINGKADIS